MITVRVENRYTDGHRSTREVRIAAAPDGLDDASVDAWFEAEVFDHTGDGHYVEVFEATGERLGSAYFATVVAAPDHPQLVGRSFEWLD